MTAIASTIGKTVDAAPTSATDPFDDFMNLRQRSFSAHRLIVFDGRSGSGKSTAISFLLRRHRDVQGRRVTFVDLHHEEPPASMDVAVIDEIRHVHHFPVLIRTLFRSRLLVVASHLGAAWYRPLQTVVKTSVLHTDRDGAKIRRRLDTAGISVSDPVLDAYVRSFGATYTDMEIILERYPDRDFDRSFARFRRYCNLRAEHDAMARRV